MSLSAGYRIRNATAGDAARAAAVVRAFELHGLGEIETSPEDVEDEWRELDPARDVWLVEDEHGDAVAYGAVYDEGAERATADGYVVPAAQGRGLGSLLVERMEARAREKRLSEVQNYVLATDTRAHALLDARGYVAVRRFARMLAELDGPPRVVEPSPGFSVRTFRPEAEASAFHAVLEEAFAEHWGFRPEPFETWRERTMGSDRFYPTLWLVAEEGHALVGTLRATWKRSDAGWVNDLGVVPSARRRGIALALLTRAFAEFEERGERRVALGVDSRNETGATRLYERAGMRTTYAALVYEKTLAGAT